jgi:Glutathione S-transferase, C-terminal domain
MAMRATLANETLPPMMRDLDAYLSGPTGSIAGKMTISDLEIYNMVSWLGRGILDGVPKDICSSYPNIMGITNMIKGNPKVVAFEATY